MDLETLKASQLFFWIVSSVGVLLFGVIAWFFKQSFDRVAQTEKDVKSLEATKATKIEVEKTEKDVKHLEETKASKDEVKELSGCISKVKEDYITKEDFYREQAKTDRKLDRIIDILLERKSQNDG